MSKQEKRKSGWLLRLASVGVAALTALALAPATALAATGDEAAADDVVLTVYEQQGLDGTPVEKKAYTQADLDALQAQYEGQEPMSAMYNKKGWQIITTAKYIPLDEFLADAGVTSWGEGDRLKATGAGDYSFEAPYALIASQNKFFPKAAGTTSPDPTDYVNAPAVLALSDMSAGTSATKDAAQVQEENAQNQGTQNAPRVLWGISESDYTDPDNSSYIGGNRFASVVSSIVVKHENRLTVYEQDGADGKPVVAKVFTESELASLRAALLGDAGSQEPVSGMYFKSNAWNVLSSDNYITLDDLLKEAGVAWAEGDMLVFGGDGDPTTGLSGKTFSAPYALIASQNKFFPAACGDEPNDPSNAVSAPAVVALTSYASITGGSVTAEQAQTNNLDAADASTAPRIFWGISESDYTDPSGEDANVGGNRYWSSNTYFLVQHEVEATEPDDSGDGDDADDGDGDDEGDDADEGDKGDEGDQDGDEPAATEPAGTWVKAADGRWWYSFDDGSYATGWEKIAGTWYLFDSNGWMLTGWQSVGGAWYYLKASGAMAEGWLSDGGAWYYLNPGSGAMATGWKSVDGEWYYMNGSGAMQTGWVYTGGEWYYLRASGAMVSNAWVGDYYLGSSGAMATMQWVGPYWVGADGKWSATA